MCKRFAVYLVTAGLMAVAASSLADPPAGYPFVRYDEGLRQAAQAGKKVFLYYGRYGCGYCDKTNKESFSEPELRSALSNHYVLVYVDAESNRRLTLPSGERITELDLGSRLKAKVTPVFMVLEPDGTPIATYPGFQTVQDLKSVDRYIQSGQYRTKTLAEFQKTAP